MVSNEWRGFPSTRDDSTNPWAGMWKYGVDFCGDTESYRVIAVNVGGSESKYGVAWLGPIDVRNETNASTLEAWAERTLGVYGGYVHLFPADGDAADELKQWAADREEAEL